MAASLGTPRRANQRHSWQRAAEVGRSCWHHRGVRCRSHLTGLIGHPRDRAVLLRRTETGWALPRVAVDAWAFDNGADISAWFEAEIGTPLRTVGYASFTFEDQAVSGSSERVVTACYRLEVADPAWTPSVPHAWHVLADLETLTWATPEDRRRALSHRDLAPTHLRPPWWRRGWYDEVEAWIDARLEASGRARRGPIRQVKVWSISTVLVAETDRGRVYFKATAPAIPQVAEGEVVAALAARLPDLVEAPLAFDSERGWILIANQGEALGENQDARFASVLAAFAAAQAELVGEAEPLLAAGLRDARLPSLLEAVSSLAASPVARDLCGDALWNAFLERRETLEAKLRELHDLGPGPTLLHGDLWAGNVIGDGRSLRLIDWTDAGVGHPFLDFAAVHALPRNAEADALRRACWAPWAERRSTGDLEAAWSLSAPLSALIQATRIEATLCQMEPHTRADLAWQMRPAIEAALTSI